MRQILVIGKNTFKEIIRDRVLYGLLVFALLLIGVSLALGELSFSEQTRISANFGLTGIHLGAVILSIFVGSTLVSREIEKKTIFTLLVRPLSRIEFILGKALGLGLVNLTVVGGLSLVLSGIFIMLEADLNLIFVGAIWGILLEALVLLGVTLFFSSFATPMMTVVFAASIFFIGHWINSLQFFAEHSSSGGFKLVSQVVTYLVPNLENFNWRSYVIYQDPLPIQQVVWASMGALSWFFLFVGLTALVFRRKDFV